MNTTQGRACVRCNSTERYASNNGCAQCQRARSRSRRQNGLGRESDRKLYATTERKADVAARAANRRAAKLHQTDLLRADDVLAVFREGKCANCACAVNIHSGEIDHIVPLGLHGSNTAGNLQALCKRCHADKTQAERSRIAVSAHARRKFREDRAAGKRFYTLDRKGKPREIDSITLAKMH